MTTAPGGCPACGAELVGGGDFSVWCAACDWNVDPDPPPASRRLRGWWERRQNTLALNLADDVRGRQRIRRAGLGVRAAVWLASGLVHVVTLSLLAAAVLTLLAGGPLAGRLVFAGVLLALFLVIQPLKLSARLPGGLVVDRTTAPNLFALIDRVATAVGTTPVKRVLISSRYNAAYLKDRRRRPTMEIGVPLWVVLTPQERVALLGHELGHRVNGDLRDLAFVAYALHTLDNWIRLFNPGGVRVIVMSGGDPARGLVNLAELMLPVVLFPVTLLLSLIGGCLELLAMRQGQRCEYYADEMGARAAGTPAAAGLEDKSLISDACMRQLRHLIRFQSSQNPWQGLAAFVQSMPPTELERLRRQARKRLHRIDTTHPPTALRLDYVNSLPEQSGSVQADADQMRLINAELNAAAERVTARLRSAYA